MSTESSRALVGVAWLFTDPVWPIIGTDREGLQIKYHNYQIKNKLSQMLCTQIQ